MWPFRDLWLSWRDRILTDRRFLRFASTSRILAPISRRQASGLFDVVAGFVYSQILFACVRLDIFGNLREAPLTPAALAARLGLASNAVHRLLSAAVPLGLVEERSGGRYGLGRHGATILANPGIAAMVEHHAALYRDLADPVDLLRCSRATGALNQYWAYAADVSAGAIGDDDAAPYTRLMSASQTLVADQVLASYSFARSRVLLDIGGGDGTFLAAIAERWPHLQLRLFDLPPVAARARQRFERAGLAGRATVHAGSFFTDPLPCGADSVSLVRVLHDHDDDRAQLLLQRIRSILPPGGTLLIAEPLAGTPGAERMGAAYFGMYLLAMGSGRPRRFEEVRDMLQRAGFGRVRSVRTPLPLQTGLIIAEV